MDRLFSLVGKIALVLIVVNILVAGGYYLATGKLPFSTSLLPAAAPTTAPTPLASPTPRLAPTPTMAPPQTVTGGGLTGLDYFSKYSLTVPSDWTVKKEETSGTQKITVSRRAYSLSIYQAATGGVQCLYPGDPAAEMATTFSPATTIYDADGREFRRATPATETSGYTVCQRTNFGFGLPTLYGHITYGAPEAPDPEILKQMDAIFGTFKKL